MGKPIICSACLLGICCRYDGKSKPNEKVLALAKMEILIPVCPEQLGGLKTPRPCSEFLLAKFWRKMTSMLAVNLKKVRGKH